VVEMVRGGVDLHVFEETNGSGCWWRKRARRAPESEARSEASAETSEW